MDTPKLHELARMLGDNGAEFVMLLIKGMLADFLAFTGSDWTPPMIDGVLNIIKKNYGHLTMAQWKLFFEKSKAGQMAQEGQRDNQSMIARITPMIFSQWLLTYSAKCEEANEDFYASKERARLLLPKTEEVEYVPQEQVSEVLTGFISQWEVEIAEQKRIEFEKKKEQLYKDMVAFAKRNGINLEEVENDILKDNQNSAA